MKPRAAIVCGVLALVSASAIVWCFSRNSELRVAHQRPYRWDQCRIPTLQFTNAPITFVVARVNEEVRKVSLGAVNEAVIIDTNATRLLQVAVPAVLAAEADEMLTEFRCHEEEMRKKGAHGFETSRSSDQVLGGHSLACAFMQIAEWSGLQYEETPGALVLRRSPQVLHCRAYKVSDALSRLTDKWLAEGQIHTDFESVPFVFAKEGEVYSWTIMLPDGPGSSVGEQRLRQVVKFLRDKKTLLVLETPEGHERIERNLKQKGLWSDL